ncbi:MAG TPA: alpha/beta-type small acid-soluble spore protein [Candidatus Pullichristensenella stercoripullorum]|nr:alpha/beta-type small acid-soluble spore protein [Candidatus Pullichristensenella stercoripullorum]
MSNSSSNRINVPEARQALSNMKYEIANEMGINLTKGYNGNLSAKENGSIGGMMVKRMIEDYQRQASGK